MIIIAENKKNHYLIKKFLIETGMEKDSSKRHFGLKPVSNVPPGSNPEKYVQLGLTPIGSQHIHTDTEVIKPGNRKFQELVKKNKKYSKLSNLAIKGFLTFGMIATLFNAMPSERSPVENAVEKEMISNHPNNAEEISLTFDNLQQENTEDVIIDYEKNPNFEEIINKIIGHEDFRPTPYPDHKQWSIGYGSRVSEKSGSFIDESQHNKLRPKYDRLYRKYQRTGSNKDLKNLINWTNKNYKGSWYKDLHDLKGNTKNYTITLLTKEKGRNMLVDSLKKELARLKSNANFDLNKMPSNIQIALSDMAYNMGGAFINEFKKLHACLVLIDQIQNKKNITKLDQNVLEDLFLEASHEIQDSDYFKDLPTRAGTNIKLVKNAIENFKISDRTPQRKRNVPDKNLQPESIKKIYQHLFV
jgi:hypothetical protein